MNNLVESYTSKQKKTSPIFRLWMNDDACGIMMMITNTTSPGAQGPAVCLWNNQSILMDQAGRPASRCCFRFVFSFANCSFDPKGCVNIWWWSFIHSFTLHQLQHQQQKQTKKRWNWKKIYCSQVFLSIRGKLLQTAVRIEKYLQMMGIYPHAATAAWNGMHKAAKGS